MADDPGYPSDLDLRNFPAFLVDVAWLSSHPVVLTGSESEIRAFLLLLCRAWHEIPAGSLPDEDRLLSHYAGFGTDLSAWRAAKKKVMTEYSRSEGRYYHSYLVEKAVEVSVKRLKQRERTSAATAARKYKRAVKLRRTDEREIQRNDQRNDDQANITQPKQIEQKLSGSDTLEIRISGLINSCLRASKFQHVPKGWDNARQTIHTWLKEGFPIDLIEAVIVESLPSLADKQVHSISWFKPRLESLGYRASLGQGARSR